MALAQGLFSLGEQPAMDIGVRRVGADAGDFGEGALQLGLYALRIVLQRCADAWAQAVLGPAFDR